MSTFIRSLLALYVHNQLGKKNKKKKAEILEWDTARGSDFRCVASAVYCIDKNASAVPSISSLTKWLQESEELDDDLREEMHLTFKIFVAMAKHKEYRSCFELSDKKKKFKVAPAEFIMITVLIYRNKGKLTMQQLSEAIEKMRLDVRGVEVDIRMNSRVFKHMLNFIVKLRQNQLQPDSRNDVAAIAVKSLYTDGDDGEDGVLLDSEDEVEDEVDELEEEVDSKGKGRATSGKRKRALDDDDDDADYKPKSTATPSRAQRTPAKPIKRAPTPPEPSSSAPPPYSTQPSLPRQLSYADRLDAIRRAKTYDTPAPPPVHPDDRSFPSIVPTPPLAQNAAAWNDLGTRLSSMMGPSDVSRALLERFSQSSYTQPVTSPVDPMRYAPEAYARGDPNPNALPPGYPRRH